MSEGNQISFTVNNINTTKKAPHMIDGMIALKKIQHFSYALSDQIGLGYSSHVYKGKNDKTNEIVAIKVIDIKKQDDLHKQFTNDEITILEKIKNANAQYLLRLEGVFKTKNNLYIITQFCQGKDVAKILRQKKFFTQQQAQGIMKQFLKGYGQLYRLKIVHRDLKLANIFVQKGKCILADFGFAIDADRCRDKFDYNVGSPFYMPPQSLKFNRYSYKSDVWAIGVIAYELIYGKRPWKQRDDDVLIQKISNTNIDELFQPGVKISQGYKQFIRDCLRVDYDKRVTPEYVINYQWNNAMEYIDGLLDPNQNNRAVSLAKFIPNIQPASAKNVSYKPIQLEEFKHRKFSQNGQAMYSLMNRQQSPHNKDLTQIKKNSGSYHVIQNNQHKSEMLHQHQRRNQRFMTAFDNVNMNNMNNFNNINNNNNIDNAETQQIILSQVHYCRFLNNVFVQIQNCNLNKTRQLLPQIGARVLQRIDFLSRLQNDQQNQQIPGLRRYISNPRWIKLKQMIQDYKIKYFSKLSQIVPHNSINKQTLSIESIKNNIMWLKTRGVTNQNQRLLQQLTFLYQVNQLQSQRNITEFAKESRIQYLVNCKSTVQNGENSQRLIKKLNYLGF